MPRRRRTFEPPAAALSRAVEAHAAAMQHPIPDEHAAGASSTPADQQTTEPRRPAQRRNERGRFA